MCGGVAALAAAIILGPRIGRFHDKDGNPLDEPVEFAPHSVALQFLGTFCLWFGWYGFNPGSVLFINSTALGQAAALVTVNTTLGACAGAVSGLFTSTLLDWWFTGMHTYDLTATMNGCLTGLAAITAGAAVCHVFFCASLYMFLLKHFSHAVIYFGILDGRYVWRCLDWYRFGMVVFGRF
jgi:ammonium transporter, Amt family